MAHPSRIVLVAVALGPWAAVAGIPSTTEHAATPAHVVRDDECASCHAVIHDEWRNSKHAAAWTDPLYQRALAAAETPELCHACHVPDSVQRRLGKMPNARTDELHLGISCDACHVADGDGTLAGPYGTDNHAHATIKHPAFTRRGSITLCASCHDTKIGPVLPLARDFMAAGLAERGKSCVGCHMPRVDRSIANRIDAPDTPDGPKRTGRSHALLGPSDAAFCAKAFRTELVRADGPWLRLRIANRAGHRVPGLTTRSFPFTVRQVNADGNVVAERIVRISAENILKVGETRVFGIRIADGAVRAEIVVEHVFDGSRTELHRDAIDL